MSLLQTLFGNVTTAEAKRIVSASATDSRECLALIQRTRQDMQRYHDLLIRCQQEIECTEYCALEPNEERGRLIKDLDLLLRR